MLVTAKPVDPRKFPYGVSSKAALDPIPSNLMIATLRCTNTVLTLRLF